MGSMMGHNLAGYKHLAIRNLDGILSVVGMVTPILENFNFELGVPLQQERHINRQNLNKKFIIAKVKESYVYEFVDRIGHASSILLPNVALTSIQTFCNLKFDISKEFLYLPALAHQLDYSSRSSIGVSPTLVLQGSTLIDPEITAQMERLKKIVPLQQQAIEEMGKQLKETN